jgi:hypothetical protein
MSLNLQIKGIWAYQAKEEYDAGRLTVGELVTLEREPQNMFDPNAVAILLRNGSKLGHIPKEEAVSISRSLAAGVKYKAKILLINTSTYKGGKGLDVYIAIDVEPILSLNHVTEIRVAGTSIDSAICCMCSKTQKNKPTIVIDGNTYCYKCSEKAKRRVTKSVYEELWEKYRAEKVQYDKDWKSFQEKKNKWEEEKWQAIRMPEDATLNPKYLIVSIISAMIGFSISSAGGLILGLIVAFIYYIFAEGEKDSQRRESREKLEKEYEGKNPPPHFNKIMPNKPNIKDSFETAIEGDQSELKYSRNKILSRDKYQCQRCGKKCNAEKLEVHHIIPRSQGGKDIADNLITLCKYCHDREKWFGHVRKYPTTLI